MEPVRSWGPAQAAAWLRGLDTAVQGYPFEAWGLSGPDLLGLDVGVLEALGVWPLGHQELLLEAVEQLRNLDTGLESTSLRTLTERLQELAQGIQSLVQEGLSAGDAPQPPSLTLLARVIDLVGAAKELFSWLNRSGVGEGTPGCRVPPTLGAEFCLPPRYLFSTLNDFSASRDIILLCAQLAETLQAARGAARAPLTPRCHLQCQHIVGICESIVGCSPPALLDRRAVLQHVRLELPPGPQGSPPMEGGREPRTGHPTVPLPPAQALAAHGDHILPGDEIVQVNEQVVVGWTPISLARKLLEKGNTVTLVLKKIPLDLPGSPPSPRQQVSDPSAPSPAQVPGLSWELGRNAQSQASPIPLEIPKALGSVDRGPLQRSGRFGAQGSRFSPSIVADLDSGPDSTPDPVTDEEEEEVEQDLRLPGAAVEELPGLSGRGRMRAEGVQGRSSSPQAMRVLLSVHTALLAVHRCCRGGAGPCQAVLDGAGGCPGGSLLALPSPDTPNAVVAGVATRLSRRRVSCRDLGRVDCDGWLLKKKDHVGFMAQKWKRCWFVLKGHTLYWYNHPNDERAAGLINVATYNLESTREQKKKYVFQLCHQTYKPFVFAAETLADLSMWVSRLVTAKTKYTLAHQAVPDKEEDCYSETEAEDPDDESPKHGSDSVSGRGGHPGDRGTEVPCLTSCPRVSTSQGRGCRTPQRRRSSPQPAAQPAAPRAAPGPAPPWVGAGSFPIPATPPSPASGAGSHTGEPCGVSGLPSCSSDPCPCPDPAGEDLESLMQCLRQGGVSLMGQRRFLTQEQCRKSFLRRNKNPHINERVHAVRALQSTLKAKLAELQALEQLLGEAAVTSDTFRRWKEEHQELYQELREGWAGRQGHGHDQGDAGDQHKEAAEP
ncbi:CNKR1 kinase, partial [Chaetorhynchus papuensis]|nr:CNKR1 kinase [Chaetorhynchus papuensis]